MSLPRFLPHFLTYNFKSFKILEEAMFAGALFFIDSSLYSLKIFECPFDFDFDFTVYYYIIFTQVTVSARREGMVLRYW